jgi:hypothetical protein
MSQSATVEESPPVLTRLNRPLVAGLVLLVVYVGLSFLNDDRAFLGTDTGGKVATLEAMTEADTLDPDIGYWAESGDPDGRVHSLYYTTQLDGRWINVTTLPMIIAVYPLYEAGGYRLGLLFPMLGSIAAAFAARALARRLGGEEWAAFWVVGLASPVVIYALDLWEHSAGLAFMAWAIVVLVDARFDEPTAWRGALAGALFGLAATMRTEALIYGVVSVAIVVVSLVVAKRRSIVSLVGFGAATLVATVVPLVLNSLLEVWIMGDTFRSGRAAGTAARGGSDVGLRVEEALLTTFGLQPSRTIETYVIGLGLFALLAYIARRGLVEGGRAKAPQGVVVAAGGLGALYLLRFADGLGFVSGMVAAAPFAAVGATLAWDEDRSKIVALMAIVPLPLVWMFQYTGGAGPQWAGRYVLTSGWLLVVLGVVHARRLIPWVRTGLIVLSVAVTAFGGLWLVQRSADVAASGETLAARPEPVVISRVAHQTREHGAFYDDHLWLTASSQSDVEFAAELVAEAGYDSFVLTQFVGEPPTIEGWELAGSEEIEFIDDVMIDVLSYERTG